MDYCDIECLALEMNRDHSVVFEIASRYCILDSFVDCDGYCISSKGFLPTVVDIVVILLSKIFGIVAQLFHFLLFSLYFYKLVAPLIFLSYIFFFPPSPRLLNLLHIREFFRPSG